ncbi:MAG TPA: hypothetical protein VK487_10055 [Candidatus Bathyarchaeia archaeon]|nr:hypothetical protein [Candidatus Bathyarchaeia archaeon]
MTVFRFANIELERLKPDERKAELEAGIIRYIHVGYVLILFAPLVSVFSTFWFFGISFFLAIASPPVLNYSLFYTMFYGLNVSIMALLIIGITMYVYGHQRREAQPSRAEVISLSLLVILWGAFTCLVATALLRHAIDQSIMPGARALTIWDFVAFGMWDAKGTFGIGTGVLLIRTSPLKTRALFSFQRARKEVTQHSAGTQNPQLSLLHSAREAVMDSENCGCDVK